MHIKGIILRSPNKVSACWKIGKGNMEEIMGQLASCLPSILPSASVVPHYSDSLLVHSKCLNSNRLVRQYVVENATL